MTESNETRQVRLHVGGLPGKISDKDIEDRFKSFGKVQKIDLIPHPFEEGICRGFAYVNIETSDAQLTKCMNVLNGCAWKGGKLQISFAKANKFRTLDDGRIIFIKNEEEGKNKKKKMPKKKRKLVRHAGDLSLVTDKNVDKRKGWRRGRYGRAIACLRIRRPNRQMLIIDPSHYKNSLEKLFGSVKPKPLSQLYWSITEIKSEYDDKIDEKDYEISDNEVMEDVEDLNIVDTEPEQLNNIISKDLEVLIEAEPVQEITVNQELETQNTVTEAKTLDNAKIMDTEPFEEDPIIVNTIQSQISVEESKSQEQYSNVLPTDAKPEAKFEVNVNWSSLFAPSTNEKTNLFGDKVSSGGFSLNSLIEKSSSSKIKNVSMDELFKKPEVPIVAPIKSEELVQTKLSATETVKKVHNYAHLFGDLNRITPTTATRFGMHMTRKEDMLQEWRIERLELKEDFKKRAAEGKRRNKRGNNKVGSV